MNEERNVDRLRKSNGADGVHPEREDGSPLNGKKVVRVAFHPRVAGGKHESGDADGEQQKQRQDVETELLNRDRPVSTMRRRNAIITPAMTRKDAHTRPWKMTNPTIDSIANVFAGKPNTYVR